MEEEQMEESCLNPNADICTQLMQRYSSSSAPQHRHLLAAASALKSIILQQPDSLSLSPLSYFAAAMSSLSSSSSDDGISSSSALSTLLSLSLPLVPRSSLPPLKAADAATVLVRVLDSVSASASSAKCVLKSLGLLLAFIDLSSWDSLRLPFHTLLLSSLDKRPKVRKCALLYLQNALMSFPSGFVTDKASDLILSSLQNCMSTASDTHHQPHCSDILHLLGVVRVALPYLSDQVSVKLVKILVDLLNAGWFSASPLPILTAIEAFFHKADIGVFTLVAEDIVAGLSSYLSSKTNSTDTLVLAANLLSIALQKLHSGDTIAWLKSFPLGVKAIGGWCSHPLLNIFN